MRRLLPGAYVLLAIVVVPVLLAAPVQTQAMTLGDWWFAPDRSIRVGDKLFTLISTEFDLAVNVQLSGGTLNTYAVSLQFPTPYNQFDNTTRRITYRVTIVDDPASPANEALLNFFNRVSWDGAGFVWSGTFTVTGVFDDDADFSSPLFTIIHNAGYSGWYVVPGLVQQLYVKLAYTANGYTLLNSHTLTFEQKVDTIPVEDTNWGRIKELYR